MHHWKVPPTSFHRDERRFQSPPFPIDFDFDSRRPHAGHRRVDAESRRYSTEEERRHRRSQDELTSASSLRQLHSGRRNSHEYDQPIRLGDRQKDSVCLPHSDESHRRRCSEGSKYSDQGSSHFVHRSTHEMMHEEELYHRFNVPSNAGVKTPSLDSRRPQREVHSHSRSPSYDQRHIYDKCSPRYFNRSNSLHESYRKPYPENAELRWHEPLRHDDFSQLDSEFTESFLYSRNEYKDRGRCGNGSLELFMKDHLSRTRSREYAVERSSECQTIFELIDR